MNSLERSIIATLSYFDIFDYPLTLMEIWKWLLVEPDQQSVSIEDIQQSLEQSDFLKKKIESKFGFYFLHGRKDIVEVRRERYSYAERKFHKAMKIIRIIRLVPFVKMVAVCNTLAYNNSRKQADIDLFIITKRKRVWQVRFWVTGFLRVLGLRPTPGKTQDTICPSFYIDEDHLDIEELAIKDDVYLPYWVVQVFPVYDQGVYQKFIEANQWVSNKLPNRLPITPSPRRRIKQINWLKNLLTVFCYFIPESLFKSYQMKIMPDKLKAMANKDSRVVVRDYVLKFHDDDRRQLFLDSWQKRLNQVI